MARSTGLQGGGHEFVGALVAFQSVERADVVRQLRLPPDEYLLLGADRLASLFRLRLNQTWKETVSTTLMICIAQHFNTQHTSQVNTQPVIRANNCVLQAVIVEADRLPHSDTASVPTRQHRTRWNQLEILAFDSYINIPMNLPSIPTR